MSTITFAVSVSATLALSGGAEVAVPFEFESEVHHFVFCSAGPSGIAVRPGGFQDTRDPLSRELFRGLEFGLDQLANRLARLRRSKSQLGVPRVGERDR